MRLFPRYLVGAATLVFFLSAYSKGPIVGEVSVDHTKYIEVCSHGIVYLPPDTKFVTCQGRVMRVIAIVPAGEVQPQVAPDCYCPKCCGGACAVTVSCGGGGLCTVYLAC
jgi:hypothetical protein